MSQERGYDRRGNQVIGNGWILWVGRFTCHLAVLTLSLPLRSRRSLTRSALRSLRSLRET